MTTCNMFEEAEYRDQVRKGELPAAMYVTAESLELAQTRLGEAMKVK